MGYDDIHISLKQMDSFQVALENNRQVWDTKHFEESELLSDSLKDVSLQDVLETIVSVERSRRAKGWLGSGGSSHDRLKYLLAFVERYSKAIDCLVQTSTGAFMNPATMIWGLLRIVMEIASAATRYMTSLLNLLEDLGNSISLYSAYEDEILFDQPRFRNAMAAVYMDIINILIKARKILTKHQNRGCMIILRYFVKTFESDFAEDTATFQRHLKVLKNEATLCHRLKMHKMVGEERPEAAQTAVVLTDQEQKINAWLSPLDCRSRLAEINAIRHPGSGAWLLENAIYRRWRDNASSPLLWISGAPGMGKTVLSSSIVRDVESYTGSAVAYFSSDASDDSSRTTLGLLTSLIAQLKGQYQSRSPISRSPECLLQAYESSVKYGRPHIHQADSPTSLVRELISLYEQTVFVIDGLDEMAEPNEAIEALLQVSQKSESLRIVFLSRHIPAIKKKLQHLPQITLSSADLKKDIRSYVQKKAEDLPLEDLAERESTVNNICTRAEGMFLWARMVMDDLSAATSPSHIQNILSQCPPGLHGMYGHFLRELASQSPERQKLTRDILRWVVCAARSLTVEELQSALTTTLEDDVDKPFRSVVIEACSPFVVVTASEGFVRPVHQSVREFLLQDTSTMSFEGNISTFFVQHTETHSELALRCVRYLNAPVASSPSAGICHRPFVDYAMVSWCYHAVSGRYRADLERQIGYLIGTSAKRQAWLYHMFFRGAGESYPFQKIFTLRAKLQDWATGQDATAKLAAAERLNASEKDWNMDALELLIMLSSYRNDGGGGEVGNVHSNVDISYFEAMIVMRDLARRLTQSGYLEPAIARLESLRAASSTPDSRFVHRISFLLNSLGMLYDQNGQTELSRDVHLEALQMQRAAAGGVDISESEDPEATWTINELGRMYRHLGQYSKAVELHASALEVLTKTLAPDHPERLWTMGTMARALRAQNLLQEALALHVETYDAQCLSPGKLHSHTLWSCGDVAKCYRDMGCYEDALLWFQKALDGRLETLGSKHPDTLWSMNHVGLVLADLGRHEEAMKMQRKALDGQTEVLGAEHKHTQWTRAVVEDLDSKPCS